MADVEERLRTWLEAGVIDPAAAERIREFEAVAEPATSNRPTVMEAVIYLGLAAMVAGVAVLAGSRWESLFTWARIAVPAVPGLLGIAAGQAMRTAPEPPLRRGGHVAWLAAAVLLVITTAVSETEAGWDAVEAFLLLGAVAAVVGTALWVFSPSHPQVVGMAAGLLVLGVAIGANASEHEVLFGALSVTAFGIAGVAGAELGILRPAVSGRALSAIAVAAGAYYAGLDDVSPPWPEGLVFLAGGGLVALSIRRGGLIYMVAGVAALFVGLVTVIARHVDDPTIAAVLLMLIGAALIAGVLLLVRFRPWVRTAAAP